MPDNRVMKYGMRRPPRVNPRKLINREGHAALTNMAAQFKAKAEAADREEVAMVWREAVDIARAHLKELQDD